MSRSRSLIISLAAVSALTFGAINAAGSLAVSKAKPATIELRGTSLGKVVAAHNGFTLYVFTHDRRNRDTCVKISGCTGTWPVLKTSGRPRLGRGLKSSLLGTITLPHGVKQVSYAGHPLYLYSGDTGPGQTDYVGTPEFGGTWYAINAAGKVVK